MGAGVAVAALSGACTMLYSAQGVDPPPESVEALVAQVADVHPDVMVNGRHIGVAPDQFRTRTIREWVERAKLRFGGSQDTAADRRVIRMWLADEMKQADMRTSDAVRLIPVVLEMVFLPGAGDIEAASVKQSRTAALLLAACPPATK